MRTPIFSILFGIFLLPSATQAESATNTPTLPSSPTAKILPTTGMTLSPDEWQQLRSARVAALKANPDLITKAAQLSTKLRQFEQKLNAAMLKTDPNIAPILAKFAATQSASHPNPPPPPKAQSKL